MTTVVRLACRHKVKVLKRPLHLDGRVDSVTSPTEGHGEAIAACREHMAVTAADRGADDHVMP